MIYFKTYIFWVGRWMKIMKHVWNHHLPRCSMRREYLPSHFPLEWFTIFHRSCRQRIHTFCASGKWLSNDNGRNQLFEDASPHYKMRSFAPINCGQIEGLAAQDPPSPKKMFHPRHPGVSQFRWAWRGFLDPRAPPKKKFAPDAALSIPCNPWCCELGSVVRWWLSRYHLPPRTAIYLQYSQPSSLAFFSGVLHQHPA